MPQKDPCKIFACRIQQCLQDNRFQEPSCQRAIEDLKECCKKWHHRSLVCDGIKTEEEPPKH